LVTLSSEIITDKKPCAGQKEKVLDGRPLIIASNRGPVTITREENGEIQYQKGGGGLVTALAGLAGNVNSRWIASAATDIEREWGHVDVPLIDGSDEITVQYIDIEENRYNLYYNVIANPLLWFLQHSMWDFIRSPNIDRSTWEAWEKGYVAVNRQYADVIADLVLESEKEPVVMLQDYHLYLTPQFLRSRIAHRKNFTLLHFIHIPWPGPEAWAILPPVMRKRILESLCSVDLLGFQTRDDALNFIRTCESNLERVHVNFKTGRVWYRQHATHVRDFPISIDVDSLRALAHTEEVSIAREQLEEQVGDRKLIVRVDRTEPSKNIARGFQAFSEMLDLHPEHLEQVQFLALFVPSRLDVEEYQNYLDEIMAAAGRVNAKYGSSSWEPVRILVGEDYARAIAALQMYDVLLVNPIADGMNLVAKEGPIVNKKMGVVVLSEKAGARQQLEPGATIISPCDIYATAEALHQGLIMTPERRKERSDRLIEIIEKADINDWFCRQLRSIEELEV
jgi:trehalose 6-phosphate synthase